MKPNVVVVGSANTDMIIELERIPRPGETLLGGKFMTSAGGKGANQAVAAARAGGHVDFIARVGSDSLGDQAIAGYRRDGIDVTHVSRDRRAASGVALIFVARSGANSIAVASGANFQLLPAHVAKARGVIASAGILLTQLENPLPAIRAAVDLAFKKNIRVILNPAPARPLPAALLRRVSIVTPNESEVALLTGIDVKSPASVERAAARLRRQGVNTVIVTVGERGALIADEQGSRLVPGFRVKAVDTTGAGDVFSGVLSTVLAEGRSIDEAVRIANAAAAISVTRQGAQPSAPTRREIDRFLKAR